MSTTTPAPPAGPATERRHFPRRWRRARRALYGLVGLMALGAFAYFGLREVEPPQLHLVMPSHARVGDVVILAGAGFARGAENNLVFVGDYAARVLEASANRLLVEVPYMALDPGEHRKAPVRVQVGDTQSQTVEMMVDATAEPEPGSDAPEDDDGDPTPPVPAPSVPTPR
jgi:hypothetical protein